MFQKFIIFLFGNVELFFLSIHFFILFRCTCMFKCTLYLLGKKY